MRGHRRDSFVLAAAVGLIGITFGVFADTSGFSLAQASALSVLTFTGASQFESPTGAWENGIYTLVLEHEETRVAVPIVLE